MGNLRLEDIACHIKQAQAILMMWLDNQRYENDVADLIAAVLTVLDGCPENLEREAEIKIGK